MIPRWLLPTFGLSAVVAFLADQVATYVIAGHVSNPAVTGTFGTIAGAAYLLAKGTTTKDDKSAGGEAGPSKPPEGKDGSP